MPLYAYRCPACGAEDEAYNTVAECETGAPLHCGERMKIRLSANYGYAQTEMHYQCVATGERVTSRRQRKNLMAKHRLVEADCSLDWVIKREKERVERVRKKAAELPGLPPGVRPQELLPKLPS